MDRKQELIRVFNGIDEAKKTIVLPLIDDVVFIEDQLTNLKKLPFIKVHPSNPDLQKPTPAAKQYKELLQQYNNCIKILCSLLSNDDAVEESPLRSYLKRFQL